MPDAPRFLIGVSLKMYFTHARTLAWCEEVARITSTHPATTSGLVEFFAIPSFPSIPAALGLLPVVGAQDLSTEDAGAYTGEVSGAELAELGCRLVEVGHAERRRLFGETEDVVARKTAAAMRNRLDPVLCVGEADRGETDAAINECVRQVRSALRYGPPAAERGRVIVAYEPHWAIGAPEPGAPEVIRAVCRGISDAFSGENVLVIYGGSAGPGLLPLIADDVNGLFLGRFAHDPAAVAAILDEATALAS